MSQNYHERNTHTNLVKGKNKIQSDEIVYPKWLSSHIFQHASWPAAGSHAYCPFVIPWSAINYDYCMQSCIV